MIVTRSAKADYNVISVGHLSSIYLLDAKGNNSLPDTISVSIPIKLELTPCRQVHFQYFQQIEVGAIYLVLLLLSILTTVVRFGESSKWWFESR